MKNEYSVNEVFLHFSAGHCHGERSEPSRSDGSGARCAAVLRSAWPWWNTARRRWRS